MMLNVYKLQEETSAKMLQYFNKYEMANFMEAPDSILKDTPAAYLMPLVEDPRGTLYNQGTEQGADQTVGVIIVATADQLSDARKHAHSVFVGHRPQPELVDIPFHPMLWAGGNINRINGATTAWMDTYKTYSLGGC